MYGLHSLGWKGFQDLCQTVISEILGQTVEGFLDSHDGGRDGAFTGKWSSLGEEDLCGPFVIQCKFTSRVNHNLRLSDLSDEISKARKLVDSGICRCYVLMTNRGITGIENQKISQCLKAAGVKHVRLFGSTWMTRQICENKRLRKLVPQIYGLGDLSQVLDVRAYEQAKVIIDHWRDDLAKVVLTDAYHRAAEAIGRHGFVLLIGEPACGKTTISSLLAMAACDQLHASIIKIDNPQEVSTHWNTNESSQFFWIDDAFGVTQFDGILVNQWNYLLPKIQTMVRSGARIVMTSRDYIYNRAKRHLKRNAFPLLNESQVVIKVQELSIHEKEQILYNHIRLGNQSRSFRAAIKPFLQDVASNPHFIPETAQRLGNSFFTRSLPLNAKGISDFVERPEGMLQEIIEGLDSNCRAALAVVFMRGGSLKSPVKLNSSEEEALGRLSNDFSGTLSALNELKGSLTRFSSLDQVPVWKFRHPTVGDALAADLIQNPENLDIFLRGSGTRRLLGQVTCGEVGLENAIVVPPSSFSLMAEKLGEWRENQKTKSTSFSISNAIGALHSFLANRCSKEFLSFYLENDPELLGEVAQPGMLTELVPEVQLATNLHKFGLLPERERRAFVAKVSDYAIWYGDPGALRDQGIRSIFTDSEYSDLVAELRIELLPRLDDFRRDWQSDFSPGDYPDSHMDPLLDFLDTLLSMFGEDKSIVKDIDHEIASIHNWIADEELERIEKEEREQIDESEIFGTRELSHKLQNVELAARLEGTRSIFDDIDAGQN